MKNLLLAFAVSSLFCAPAAFAGGGGGGGESSSGSGSGINIDWNQSDHDATSAHHDAMAALGVSDDSPRVIVMPAIVVPLVTDNNLRGYAYIHSRLLVAPRNSPQNVQERTHFALDRLIRVSHRLNLTAEDGVSLDVDRTREAWLEALTEYFGAGVIENLAISPPDVRLIR